MHPTSSSCALFGSVSGSSVRTRRPLAWWHGRNRQAQVQRAPVPRHARRRQAPTASFFHPAPINMISRRAGPTPRCPSLLRRLIPAYPDGALQPDGARRLLAGGRQWGGRKISTMEARIRTLPMQRDVLLLIVIGAIFSARHRRITAGVRHPRSARLHHLRGRLNLLLKASLRGGPCAPPRWWAILVGAFFLNVVIQPSA